MMSPYATFCVPAGQSFEFRLSMNVEQTSNTMFYVYGINLENGDGTTVAGSLRPETGT